MRSLSFADAPGWVATRLRGRSGTRWVGIDGLGAAGKSTLTAAIVAGLPGAVVVAVDDFGRAHLRDWDRELFVDQVVSPLLAGRPGRYRRWDLVTDRGGAWVDVPVGLPVVVEGVSATDVRLPVPWDLTLWVDTPEDIRRRRIATRDSPALLERWERDWWASEAEYVAAQDPRARVDAVVTGTGGGAA